jgi:hypothetical protein
MIVTFYQRGIGVKQEHAAAARLLCKAAARGGETAKHNLRVFFEEFRAPYGDVDDTGL